VQRSEGRGKGRKIKKTPATSHQGDGKYPENRKDFKGLAGSACGEPPQDPEENACAFPPGNSTRP